MFPEYEKANNNQTQKICQQILKEGNMEVIFANIILKTAF